MKLVKTSRELQKHLEIHRTKGKTIGFVPTLGALHEGHMTLMRRSIENCDITVCSIFVNPTQFNQKEDLDKYPRTLDADAKMLRKEGVDFLYAPDIEDVYPKGMNTTVEIDLDGLDAVMEGAQRPGHFASVVQVVKRLLDLVLPDRLYMGQKDFQQFSVINKMIMELELPVKLVVCPIIREESGLAMSSRNSRLSEDLRQRAAIIFKVLKAVKRKKNEQTPKEAEQYALKRLMKPDFKPEYFTLADGFTLKSVKNWDKHDYIVACTAVWAGDVRLIDNIIVKKPRGMKLFKG